jgi:release factor glutamine methyltransferase
MSQMYPQTFSVRLSRMDVRTALRQGIAGLREAHVPSDTLAAELLLLHALGRERTWLYAHPEAALNSEQEENYFSLLTQRVSGIPTQHLTGKQEFWGLVFDVNADVLIPRTETEHLIEVALDRLALRELRAGRQQKTQGKGLVIADIGTGSGCIAVAIGKELPGATIYATDISSAALEVAMRNAKRHGVAHRIRFAASDLFDALSLASLAHPGLIETGAAPGSPSAPNPEQFLFDLVLCNPPYIGRREAPSLPREVRDHEPEIALYGGEEGYEFYAELIPQSALHLRTGGLLVLELGHNSLPAVQPLFESVQWANVAVTRDLGGIPRVIAAERTVHRL